MMKRNRLVRRWKLVLMICCVLMGLCVLLFGKSIEVQFRLGQLEKLRRTTRVSSDGFLMDASIDQAQIHRVRLVGLGRFFHKSYRVFGYVGEQTETNQEEIRRLVLYLDRRFPGVFWELSDDGRLDVWDDVSNELAWSQEVDSKNWRFETAARVDTQSQ